jgi:hypothetical protein
MVEVSLYRRTPLPHLDQHLRGNGEDELASSLTRRGSSESRPVWKRHLKRALGPSLKTNRA